MAGSLEAGSLQAGRLEAGNPHAGANDFGSGQIEQTVSIIEYASRNDRRRTN